MLANEAPIPERSSRRNTILSRRRVFLIDGSNRRRMLSTLVRFVIMVKSDMGIVDAAVCPTETVEKIGAAAAAPLPSL